MIKLFSLLIYIVGLLLCQVMVAADKPEKPNVILILVDDLGWQDVGTYDIDEPSPYETPYLDQLAREGVQFWQGYSPAPTCAPSRGAIIAGKHPARLQRTHVVGGAPPMVNHINHPIMSPWYSGRLPISEVTIPEALKTNGYYTGHIGKWHIAINHNAYPQPLDHGFDYTRSERGATKPQNPHRLTDFATTDANDPYRLDENGFPFHQNNQDALDFLEAAKDKPFFLYYATWLVHTPIHTRSEALLRKYCEKIGVPYPEDPKAWTTPGQTNPYYAAMVEMLDYYVGQVVTYLKETDDPRWPGHKLIENTYIIFTSDNGGMEGGKEGIFTDNYPLDKGKINAKEGGTRVPFIIKGPGILANIQSDVLVNGLDFYPTILSWTGTPKPAEHHLDGADLSTLLVTNPQDAQLVKEPTGEVRNSIMHHFPHGGGAMHSTLRIGGYKLIRNFDYHRREPLELYQLYNDAGERVDIEEMNNLATKMPEKAAEMNQLLQERLESMDASFPYFNPNAKAKLPHSDKVCKVIDSGKKGNQAWVNYQENGNKVKQVDLLYTPNGGDRYEEWFRVKATMAEGTAYADLPSEATHYIFNLVDEHQFLVDYPDMGAAKDYKKSGIFSPKAIINK